MILPSISLILVITTLLVVSSVVITFSPMVGRGNLTDVSSFNIIGHASPIFRFFFAFSHLGGGFVGENSNGFSGEI